MPCYSPVEVGVKSKFSGVRRPVTVGCGHCIGCRAEQARQWSVRLMHERQMHDASWFLTLTYDEERIPENGSLCSEDFRGFVKALRRDYPSGSVRYYGCGEYGSLTQRPHYHAVLYGVDFLDKRPCTRRADRGVWESETLGRYWPFGISEFGTVTSSSAAYVAGYVRKKIGDVGKEQWRVDDATGELVRLENEFSRMSLRPAIGRTWIEKYWKDVYPRDSVVVDGNEFKPPRYYDKWMDEHHPDVMMQVREKRIEQAQERSEYQLEAGEAIHKARVALFSPRNTI